ncbi:MAG: hypothetical protein FJX77_14715, partial [Armatimonadetes bacterium]|nr:hypothetical protein [Armatimonadota bacterium]
MSNFWRNCAFGCAGLVVLLAIAVVGGAVWLRTELTAKPPPGPRLAPNTVFRPVFQMQNGKVFSAGTAFALRLRTDGMPLAVTALHLFGPSGGLDKDIPASELSRAVREVLLVPIGRNAPVARAARAMTSTGRPVGDDGDVSGDVAAFLIPRPGRIPVLQPAGDNPRMGEWIWLVGDAVNHKPQSQRLFPARAITVSQKGLT